MAEDLGEGIRHLNLQFCQNIDRRLCTYYPVMYI